MIQNFTVQLIHPPYTGSVHAPPCWTEPRPRSRCLRLRRSRPRRAPAGQGDFPAGTYVRRSGSKHRVVSIIPMPHDRRTRTSTNMLAPVSQSPPKPSASLRSSCCARCSCLPPPTRTSGPMAHCRCIFTTPSCSSSTTCGTRARTCALRPASC